MCCGSRRSAWRSTLAVAPSPRRAPTAAPVTAGPVTPTQEIDGTEAAAFARASQPQQAPEGLDLTPARSARRWGLAC
jgi:hypothetical protein